MHQFGTLWAVDAREVKHADAVALWPPNGCTSATVNRGVAEKMLATVQPNRSQLGQGSADGGGAYRLLGQVHTDTRNCFHPFVVAVDAAAHIQDHAFGVCQQSEKRGSCDGPAQAFDFGLRCLNKIALKVECAGNVCRRNRVKSHAVVRVQSIAEAATPAVGDPLGQCGGGWLSIEQHGKPVLLKQGKSV